MAIIASLGCLVYIKWIFKAPALPGPPGSSVTVSGKVKDKTYGEDGSLKNFTVGNALCSVGDTEFSKEPEVGSTVAVSGTLKTFRQAMNKGGYDEETYHRVRGEDYRLYVSSVVELKKAEIGLSEKLCKLKQKLAQRIIRYCPLEYGTVKTLILGDKSSLSEERKDLYQRVSLSHFLVISGLHISAAAALLYRLLRALLRRRAPASLLTLSILVLYGLMIGFSVSVLRAVIMYGVRLAADLTNETYDIISAASLAAVITLINNPLFLTDASFLYSYIAVYTIGFFYDSGVVTGLKGIKEKLKDALRFSLVMVFGMFPVTMYFSGTYSLGALALNLFIVPFGPVMLFAAFMAFLFSILGIAPAAGFFDFIEACLIRLTDRVADLMA
ncbi:MAG: ComEC/Rec2 family competence protein, partial [Lachnospiraceae bacterium]|nr:ComEC/Rec2 family competence protein [Lachnospiraceae bacterium]